mmetsp:Transcript_56621/g.177298  ORF Transcript_56621/g.177298 Transcript_56621/m.177298 type:complete len:218 (-) Transcript_56621:444-1097(-)
MPRAAARARSASSSASRRRGTASRSPPTAAAWAPWCTRRRTSSTSWTPGGMRRLPSGSGASWRTRARCRGRRRRRAPEMTASLACARSSTSWRRRSGSARTAGRWGGGARPRHRRCRPPAAGVGPTSSGSWTSAPPASIGTRGLGVRGSRTAASRGTCSRGSVWSRRTGSAASPRRTLREASGSPRPRPHLTGSGGQPSPTLPCWTSSGSSGNGTAS